MRACLFASITAFPAVAVLFLACGGSSPPSEGAKSPENAAATASATPEPAPSTTTTTTMTLGDGGDLQGTKLATSTTTVSPAPAPADAGASSAKEPKTPEPGRAAKDIQTIIMAQRDRARACYDTALKDHPGIEGNIDIKWTIDPTGKVTDIAVDESKSDIHEPSVGKCIIAIIEPIHFSVSGKGFETRTHYPFNFHPHGNQNQGPKKP
jgi:hypothetical protein